MISITSVNHCPLSSVFEGIFMSQYNGDETPITATPGSPFFTYLSCNNTVPECEGTAEQWIESSFPDFSVDNIKWDFLYLVGVILASRFITFVALTTLNYKAT